SGADHRARPRRPAPRALPRGARSLRQSRGAGMKVAAVPTSTPLDVRNVLWLLAATTFVVAPHVPRLPYWIAILCAIVVAWRAWIFVATLVGFNRVGKSPTLAERMRPAAALVIQALPLMAAFFLLFPRVQGPLWALPRDTTAGRTGLSDTMTPGQMSELIKSEEVAFRVQFENDMPSYGTLYFRGPVLTEFDGRTWKMPELSRALPQLRYSRHQPQTRYAVSREARARNWPVALD